MTITLLLLCSISALLCLQAATGAAELRRELERHAAGQEIKRRIVGELARKRVQP